MTYWEWLGIDTYRKWDGEVAEVSAFYGHLEAQSYRQVTLPPEDRQPAVEDDWELVGVAVVDGDTKVVYAAEDLSAWGVTEFEAH